MARKYTMEELMQKRFVCTLCKRTNTAFTGVVRRRVRKCKSGYCRNGHGLVCAKSHECSLIQFIDNHIVDATTVVVVPALDHKGYRITVWTRQGSAYTRWVDYSVSYRVFQRLARRLGLSARPYWKAFPYLDGEPVAFVGPAA